MSSVVSSSNGVVARVGVPMSDAISEASVADGMSLGSHTTGSSADTFDSSTTGKPPHPHHLTLLALSAELMHPKKNRTGKESSVVKVGLVEEARNRRRGRKERCVHWDCVEVNGKEFPLQRADTSMIAFTAPAGTGGLGRGSSSHSQGTEGGNKEGKPDNSGTILDDSDPSYLLVGHSTCDLCLMTFESSSVSGVITMKRIVEARRNWGISSAEGKESAAAKLYDPARLCALCSQFFCPEGDGQVGRNGAGFVPRGVGHSNERVSLLLESMGSNKPLPDKTTAAAVAAKALETRRGNDNGRGKRHVRRKLSDSKSIRPRRRGSSRSGDVSVASAANFPLDELLADESFVVKETDLAKQSEVVATQSSTADGMGADVCMGLPAANHRRGVSGAYGDQRRTAPRTRGEMKTAISVGGSRATRPITLSIPLRTTSNPADKSSASNSTNGVLLDEDVGENEFHFAATNAVTAATTPVSPSRARNPPMTSPMAAAATTLANARTCSRTRREEQPWWEVDLAGVYPIRCIRVHHPDRRTEATKAGALPYVDVAPFWILTAARAIGAMGSDDARRLAIASKRFASHKKVTTWDLGINHFATAVRVQAEGVKSLQLARVEVIKGGGTQQAKDAVQEQHLLHERQQHEQYCGHRSDNGLRNNTPSPPPATTTTTTTSRKNNNDYNSSSDLSLGAATDASSTLTRSKSRRVSEHTMTTRQLQHFYADRAKRGSSLDIPPQQAGIDAGAAGLALPASTVAQVIMKVSGEVGRSTVGSGLRVATPLSAGRVSGAASSLDAGGGSDNNPPDGTFNDSVPSTTTDGVTSSKPKTCPTSRGHQRQPKGGTIVHMQGEDVQRLLLRAMVGYDWVDDYSGQEVRVKGAFTQRDVEVLEEIFLHCALGDDVEARATATVSDPSVHVDPGELCGDLRRLELQVQTNTGSKNKSPIPLAVRDSPHLFQLFSSGVVQALPDALARAEAQLPMVQRPLSLDWARFLGIMGLCLEGAIKGTGTVASSAVARLFEEIHDDKLDFLTRKRSRLPPARKSPHGTGGGGGVRFNIAGGGASDDNMAKRVDGSRTSDGGPHGRAQTAPASAGGMSRTAGVASSAEDLSMREGTASIDTADDLTEIATAAGGTASKHGRGVSEMERRRRGGGNAALKSLLRPQLRHEVCQGYSEAMSRRRGRQREAMQRAPEPDVKPTRAYKPCGLCQVPFPVESLGATVSLKVLGSFLSKSGTPSERFERKASSLCALHRLPLCVFCSQFFDPDFPDGIVPPRGYASTNAATAAAAGGRGGRGQTGFTMNERGCAADSDPRKAPLRTLEANGLVPFFDDRFPDNFSETPPPSSIPCSESAGVSGLAGLPSLSARGRGWGEGSTGLERRCEAKVLREAGDLVLGGFSVRDLLSKTRVLDVRLNC